MYESTLEIIGSLETWNELNEVVKHKREKICNVEKVEFEQSIVVVKIAYSIKEKDAVISLGILLCYVVEKL